MLNHPLTWVPPAYTFPLPPGVHLDDVGLLMRLVDAWELRKTNSPLVFGLIYLLIGQLLTTMLVSLASPWSGDSGTVLLATWNIRCGQNTGLTSVAKGLVQMGVNCAVLTEVKITNDKHLRCAFGFKIISSKATSHSQGGIALLWNKGHASFEVEAAKIVTPNLLTFQLVTGYKQFYAMGIYIPPNDTTGVDALCKAWASCPANCIPLVLGNLNVNFEHPRDMREEQIIDLLDEINLVDTSQKFALRWCKMQVAKKQWTWRQKRMGRWHHTQPDYILVREGNVRHLRRVAFRTPLVHDSDHRAVIAIFHSRRTQRLKKYRRQQQRFPLRLPPGPHDGLTRDFETLRLTCKKPEPKH
jgi:hypothetical protein